MTTTSLGAKELGLKSVDDLGDTCPGFPERLFKFTRSSNGLTLLDYYRAGNALCLYLLVRLVRPVPAISEQQHLIFFQHQGTIDMEQRIDTPLCMCGQCAERDEHHRNHSMLVGVVEFSENPEYILVRGMGESFVRLFPFYERCLERGYTFYHSARSGSIPAPRVKDRELEPSFF